jgi:hypothetical protein
VPLAFEVFPSQMASARASSHLFGAFLVYELEDILIDWQIIFPKTCVCVRSVWSSSRRRVCVSQIRFPKTCVCVCDLCLSQRRVCLSVSVFPKTCTHMCVYVSVCLSVYVCVIESYTLLEHRSISEVFFFSLPILLSIWFFVYYNGEIES